MLPLRSGEIMPQEPNTVGRSKRDLAFGVYVLALLAAFSGGLASLFAAAVHNDLNSYIVLIPFVSVYFFYSERSRFATERTSSVAWAIVPIVVGVAAVLALFTSFGEQLTPNDRNALAALTFVCFLWSGGFLFLGRKWMFSASFPMFFLVFLIPLPDQAVEWMEAGLQTASAEAANFFFAITNTPAMQTGPVFQLPGITLRVAPECSGIKSSWVLFITSLIAAKLLLSKPWSRTLLVACVLPLGILRNGFRIMVIGLLCIRDPDMIHSIIHRRGGPIFFALSLIPLLLVLWLLRRHESARYVTNAADAAAMITGTK
jgi:exosortase C (VPDSG-CTERM-specific)